MRTKESWSKPERRKRAKSCDDPQGFTMRQFCRNQRTRSGKGERTNEELLRQLIREELLRETRINYPGGDSIHGVYAYWSLKLRSCFEEINGRLPTFREFAGIIEESVPGFKFNYSKAESPDDVVDDIFRDTPGGKFMDRVYRQLVKFIGNDDKKDLRACRGIEETGRRLWKEATIAVKEQKKREKAEEMQRAKEYEATYEPKAPLDAPLERYAFSPQRRGKVNSPPMEKNTPVESALLRSIRSHFSGEKPLTRQQAMMVRSFIDSGLYPDVFIEAPDGTYYRGMGLSSSDLQALGIEVPDLSSNEVFTQQGTFDIKPLGDRFSSSWTSDPEIAYAFAASPHGVRTQGTLFSVIFAASSSDNPGKFLDSAGFYDVDLGEEEFRSEKEVIGLGTIRADRVQIERLK